MKPKEVQKDLGRQGKIKKKGELWIFNYKIHLLKA